MRIGILGGGQLGRMLGLAAAPLGVRCRFWDPAPDAPASIIGEVVHAPWDDPAALDRFTAGLDAVTWEFENVPAETARRCAQRIPVFPPVAALETGQDRLAEKTLFERTGLGVQPFAPASTREELDDALRRVGLPAVVKTRRGGYDGKGQAVVRTPQDAAGAWRALGGRDLLAEAFVPFSREVSIIAVRSRAGETRFYPPVQNLHEGGILRRSTAPAPGIDPGLTREVEGHARTLVQTLGYVGVLAIEFFLLEDRPAAASTPQRLVANEMAPRVHNSGHWTIEGAEASQFENHIRAVCGLPLGACAPRGASVMVNLIGEVPPVPDLLAVPGAHVHLYGKAPRPRRKVGHVTVCAQDPGDAAAGADAVERLTREAGEG